MTWTGLFQIALWTFNTGNLIVCGVLIWRTYRSRHPKPVPNTPITIRGPRPAGLYRVLCDPAGNNYYSIHLPDIPNGYIVTILPFSADITMSLDNQADHNTHMQTDFSLDELQAAQEFIKSGGRLH